MHITRNLLLRITMMVTLAMIARGGLATQDEQLQVVKDLRYGETLFHFYQQKYFSAITRLMVAQQRQPIEAQGKDPELLLGGLYLSYGMHQAAGEIFEDLIASNASPTAQDRAWFYLAKTRYLRGYYPGAQQALLNIKGELPSPWQGERLNLLANVYMAQQNYLGAIKTLHNFDDDTEWKAYAQFNLGVALVKIKQTKTGMDMLNDVGEMKPTSREMRALRDKANLALGYTYIRDQIPAAAAKILGRVRLSGPLSNKALLGIGWAHSSRDLHEQALVPWMELKTRATVDPAVQESLLATPYTLEKIAATKSALKHYHEAINTYSTELTHVEGALHAVRTGELIVALKKISGMTESTLPQHHEDLPNSIATPYIVQFLASNQFQTANKNYRELLFLQSILRRWQRQIPAYELMLAERKKSYQDKLPRVTGDTRINMLEKFQAQRDKLAKEFAAIDAEQNAMALATVKEQATLQKLAKISKNITRLWPHEDITKQKVKYRILQGLMRWQLENDYPQRHWKIEKNLSQLDQALNEIRSARASLDRTWKQAPKNFSGYANRISTTKARLQHLQQSLAKTLRLQEKYIQKMALKELRMRRRQLENYQIRAQFSLTRLYDSIASTPAPSKIKKQGKKQ